MFDHYIYLRSCPVVETLTKAVLEPILYQIYCIGHVGFELIHVIVEAPKPQPYMYIDQIF